MFPAILALLGQVGGWVFDSVKQSREIKAAAAENTIRLLRDEQSNNHAWEMANLADKDKGLRWISFCLFVYPLIWAAIEPDSAQNYFNVILAALPDWYKEIVFTMIGGIWGVAALKNVVPSLVGETLKAMSKSKED